MTTAHGAVSSRAGAGRPRASGAGSLFDEDFLRRLEYLRLVSRTLLPGGLRGEHRARRRGSGVEFADYRPYVAGDDVRHVDWGTYLRLGKLLVRLFEEEGDLPIYLFLDTSRSMASKLDFGRRVTAALCYVGLVNLDRVSLVAYADGIASHLPPLTGQGQVWTALRFLEGLEPGGRTDLCAALRAFFATHRRRGLAVLVSDFMDDSHAAGLELLRRLRHDVITLHLVSDSDRPALPDEVLLVDAEDQSKRRLRITPSLLQAYEAEAQRLAEGLRHRAVQEAWSYLQVDVTTPFDDLVLRIFRQGRFLR